MANLHKANHTINRANHTIKHEPIDYDNQCKLQYDTSSSYSMPTRYVYHIHEVLC